MNTSTDSRYFLRFQDVLFATDVFASKNVLVMLRLRTCFLVRELSAVHVCYSSFVAYRLKITHQQNHRNVCLASKEFTVIGGISYLGQCICSWIRERDNLANAHSTKKTSARQNNINKVLQICWPTLLFDVKLVFFFSVIKKSKHIDQDRPVPDNTTITVVPALFEMVSYRTTHVLFKASKYIFCLCSVCYWTDTIRRKYQPTIAIPVRIKRESLLLTESQKHNFETRREFLFIRHADLAKKKKHLPFCDILYSVNIP